jgi:hypothetical protein
MTTVEDIKGAIEKLDPIAFDRLRAWFVNHESARFDERIARDAASGKLDHFADRAIADVRKRRG